MDARELKDQASDLFRKGKFGKAAEAYLQLTKLEPKEGQHLIKLGDSYRRDGRKEEAIVAYRKAVDDYAKQGIVIKAIAACKLILEIDPNQKDAQEALATLCAKRYVKRDDVDASQPTPPPPKKAAAPGKRAPITEPIDLPEDDGDVGEIETLGGASPQPKKAEPPKPPPPKAPPPRVDPPKPPPPKVEAASLDIDLDMNEAPMPVVAKAPPKPVVPPPPEPPPQTEVELDLGFDAPAPVPVPTSAADRRRGGQTFDLGEMSDQLDAGDAVLEGVLEEAETIGEIEPEAEDELPPGISLVTAENTGEKALLNQAAAAAKKPPTPMAEILADSLLIEGDDGEGEEIELVSVTTAAPARPPPPPPRRETTLPPGRPIETGPVEDLVDDADFAAPSEAAEKQAAEANEAAAEERHELMRLANEAAFDLSTPPPGEEAEVAPEAAKPPPAPAVPSGDVAQKDVPLFSELPRDAFLDLLEQVQFRRIDEGEVIVREGDQGKSIYILASGQAKVMKALGTDAPIELATLEDGAFFGEMALLNGAPRVASVVASADSEVLELTEVILRDLTAKHPSVATSLKKFYRQRLLSNVMAISPLFRAFDKSDRKMLVEKFKLREAKPDEAIISEGEKPDGLYVIMHGTALVAKKDAAQGRSVPLAVLKEGDVFGEMSLLSKKPASASVVAKRKTLVLRLPKSVFDELMFTHPAVLEVVSELTDQRTKVNEQILSGKVDAPREALAML